MSATDWIVAVGLVVAVVALLVFDTRTKRDR